MQLMIPVDVPGNAHHTAADVPTRVLRSDFYRVSWVDVLEPGDGWYAGLSGDFPEVSRPGDGIGLAGLESQEHSVLWFGPAAVIDRFVADPDRVMPWEAFRGEGMMLDRWPDSVAWRFYLPPTTWNPGGQGIVTEHTFPDGAQVVVYELLGRPAVLSGGVHQVSSEDLVPVVTYHCTRCHSAGGRADRFSSASPDDRRAASRQARRHMRPGNCRGADDVEQGDRMCEVVAEVVTGRAVADRSGLFVARCQTAPILADGFSATTCAEVREARKFSAGRPSTGEARPVSRTAVGGTGARVRELARPSRADLLLQRDRGGVALGRPAGARAWGAAVIAAVVALVALVAWLDGVGPRVVTLAVFAVAALAALCGCELDLRRRRERYGLRGRGRSGGRR
jgi:hypothetical protein